jgi:hypothetical protein
MVAQDRLDVFRRLSGFLFDCHRFFLLFPAVAMVADLSVMVIHQGGAFFRFIRLMRT